jgi:hypothetical protein
MDCVMVFVDNFFINVPLSLVLEPYYFQLQPFFITSHSILKLCSYYIKPYL